MITPLRNRAIVRPLIDKQSGAIAIPDQYVQSQTVEVVSVGTEMKVRLEVGQRILLHPNASWTDIEFGGEKLRVIDASQMLAIMSTE